MILSRRALLTAAASGVIAANAVKAQDAEDRKGAARDLLYQALELLSEKSTPAQIEKAIGYLKRSLDQFPGFGDAHYYRSLCLKRINEDPAAQTRALQAAASYQSEALRDKRDPFTLAVPKIYQNLKDVGQKWALVVGISRFQSAKGADPLKCAAADASSFADLLRNPEIGRFPPSQVFCLTDEKATTATIKARLNTIATKAKSDDIVVIYISTHGSSRDDDIKQVSYLLTYDTDTTSKDDIFGSALPMVEISGIVSTRCTSQRTVLIFDTCHSGESVNSQTLSDADVDRLSEGSGRYILSSCNASQRSYEDGKHGYFTSSLIAHLRDRKGCIRMNDLFAQVQKDVSERVRKEAGKSQQPVMFHSANAADLILGAAPGGVNEQCVSTTTS